LNIRQAVSFKQPPSPPLLIGETKGLLLLLKAKKHVVLVGLFPQQE
jgi:hypothetical protein